MKYRIHASVKSYGPYSEWIKADSKEDAIAKFLLPLEKRGWAIEHVSAETKLEFETRLAGCPTMHEVSDSYGGIK